MARMQHAIKAESFGSFVTDNEGDAFRRRGFCGEVLFDTVALQIKIDVFF